MPQKINSIYRNETALLSTNRCVVLSIHVPWDAFASISISMMNRNIGRPGLCPRMVLGALVIKHQENLDDSRVIAAIQENVFPAFFCWVEGVFIQADF